MAMFDSLIDDMAQRFGLGANAGPLVREALTLITGSQGGISGFLNLFKTAGLSSDVASWLGNANAAPVAAQQVERALSSSMLGGFASRFGLGQAAVSTALGYALPKLIGLLTPGGIVPTSLPAEVTSFLTPGPVHRAAETTYQRPAAPVGQAAQVGPRRIDVYPTRPANDEPVMTRWLWPLLGALALLGLLTFFWPTSNRTTVAPPVAQAPAVAPAPPPVLMPPRLTLSNDDGVIHYSGTVHDEETRNSIVNALKSVFGADKVQGDIAIDLNRAAAPWLVNFRNGIESLKTPGVQAVFDGDSVNLGGVIGDGDRDRVIASLRSILGGSLVFGSLPKKP
jgi:OmpA-OmpF porin, OOP family